MRTSLFCRLAVWLLVFGCVAGAVAQQDGPSKRLGITFRLQQDSSGVERLVVTAVMESSLGARLGIRQGDVLLSVNGTELKGLAGVRVLQMFLSSGKPLTVLVLRDGQQVTLGAESATSAPSGSSASPPSVWLGVALGEVASEWRIRGALVLEVKPGSPADYAGLLPGDIIYQVDSTPIENLGALQTHIRQMSPGQACVVHVQRGNRRFQRTVVLRAPSDRLPPARRAGAINVLKYAFIDPQSGEVTFAGIYDPSLPGGPIPYDDLLRDALTSPYPSFSLDPTPRTQQVLEQAKKRIDADMERLWRDQQYGVQWMNRLINLVLSDSRAETDRRRLAQRLGNAFGISVPEAMIILNAAADKPVDRQQHYQVIAKVMRGIGWDELADFMADDDQQNAMRNLLQRLGRWDEAEAVIQSYHAGRLSEAQALKELNTIIYPALMRRAGVPEAEINDIVQKYRANRISDSEINAITMQKLTSIVSARFLEKIMNGYALTPQTLALFYNLPVPAVQPVFSALDRHSPLGWIFYSADVTLKTLCSDPDLSARVPGHISEHEYFDQQSRQSGVRILGGADIEVGHQLQPAEAPLRVSPDGTVVAFDPAQVRIIGWLRRYNGKDGRLKSALETWIDGYARYLTERYDQYARVSPELHHLREATKVIALVRWAQASGRKLVPANPTGIRFNPPQELPGFWTAVFEVRGDSAALNVIFEGGTDYSQKVGDGWVKPVQQAELIASTSRQLAASVVFSRQAAESAANGDMETARDLAERAARAMTGEIDLSTLPDLQGNPPSVPNPAKHAQAILQSLQAIDEAAEALRAADTALQATDQSTQLSDQEREQVRKQAESVRHQAQSQVTQIQEALRQIAEGRMDASSVVVTLRERDPILIPPSVAHAASLAPTSRPSVAQQGGQKPPPTTATGKDDEQTLRARWAAELEQVEKQIAITAEQLHRLTREMQSIASQFEEWQTMAEEGMESVVKACANLLIDTAVYGLNKHYDSILEEAKTAGKVSKEEVERVQRTKQWLERLENVRTFADIVDLLSRENKTLAQILESVRDGISILTDFTRFSDHPYVRLWKYGSNTVDLVYGIATGYEAWKGIQSLDRLSEQYLQKVKELADQMKALQEQAKRLRQQMAE